MPAPLIKQPLTDIVSVEKIITFFYYELDSDFSSSGEHHDFWELVYADSGDLEAIGGDNTFHLKAGEVLLHKPDEYHHLKTDGVHGANVLIITFVCKSKAMRFFDGKKFEVPQKLKPLLRALVDEAFATFRLPMSFVLNVKEDAPVGGKQMIRNYLELFLIHMMRSESLETEVQGLVEEASSESAFANEIMKRLCEFKQYRNVEEVCASMNYSREYLSRFFKEHCHMTMNEYRTRARIREAKLLLREKGYTVAQVAELLYFTDSKHFQRVFKKSTGMTPREYMKSVKK